ncbi:MAG: hypothetical protein PHD97_00770 [Bacteroidales bacterium]|nr:hypothetical protein [Bacteroidales bacterium]
MRDIGCPQVYSLIPEKEIDIIYATRFRNVRVEAADGYQVPADMLNGAKWLVSKMLKDKSVKLLPGGPEISLYDYFTVGLTLISYMDILKEESYTGAKQIKECLAPFLNYKEGYETAWKTFIGTIDTIATMYSSFDSLLYVSKHEIRTGLKGEIGVFVCMDIYCRQPEKIDFIIDGNTRPAIRVGWGISYPEPHIDYISIKPKDLNIDNHFSELPLEVYIQSHALQRLAERLDCMIPGIVHYFVYESLKEVKLCRSHNGNFLIEYRFWGIKAGYLVGNISEGKIIIRTFLFLTNNGTPEGRVLQKDTGLLKEDKKYLEIDKLSTFINSDIRTNEKVKEIFLKAGCGSLFEFDINSIYKPDELKVKSKAMIIADYLGLKTDV